MNDAQIFCKQCGKEIPMAVIHGRHHNRAAYACNRDCEVAWRVSQDFYTAMSAAGREARSTAVAQSNREKPRRKK